MPVSTRVVARQCTLCEAHCGIRVHVTGERVTRIDGDPDDVLSHGYICPKATALADLHRDPDRLRRPLRRVGDEWEEIGWNEAFDLAGSRLRHVRRRYGRGAVAMYMGNPAAHTPSALYGVALRAVLRTRHFYTASSIDQFPQEYAAWKMFGANLLMPIADVDRTDRLLILGANPAVSNGSVTTMPDARGRIRAVRERGGTVVVVDPRRSETARLADEHVAVRPGGDPFLLLGMLHVLFADGLTRPRRRCPRPGGLCSQTWCAPARRRRWRRGRAWMRRRSNGWRASTRRPAARWRTRGSGCASRPPGHSRIGSSIR